MNPEPSILSDREPAIHHSPLRRRRRDHPRFQLCFPHFCDSVPRPQSHETRREKDYVSLVVRVQDKLLLPVIIWQALQLMVVLISVIFFFYHNAIHTYPQQVSRVTQVVSMTEESLVCECLDVSVRKSSPQICANES